jgi:outer membrane scaffolding protein for murein synthesis (MipA/OmpV family)
MDRWFGVNQNQAAHSQYPQYHASAGFKSVGFGISAVLLINKHWFATADGAFEQLVGSAGNSPITHRKANGVADVSINYRF